MPEFDQAYYTRFYENQETLAVTPEQQQKLCTFIAAYLRYLDIPIRSILDVGCGLGQMLNALQEEFPDAQTQGVEVSPYLCAKYGWHQSEVQSFSSEPRDLVVCNDVLGYLSKKEAKKAIANLAGLTESALFLSVLTEQDMDICDQPRTDLEQKVRPAAWYKTHLTKDFVGVGGGLFLKKPLAFPVWQMERV